MTPGCFATSHYLDIMNIPRRFPDEACSSVQGPGPGDGMGQEDSSEAGVEAPEGVHPEVSAVAEVGLV